MRSAVCSICLVLLFSPGASGICSGQTRDLLSASLRRANLSQVLISREDFTPYPKPGDPFWQSIPQRVRQAHVERAEQWLDKDWPSLPATAFLDFARSGNRSRYEAMTFGRRNRLADLVVAEALENQGRFVDETLNGLWLICEETYWGVPAHVGLQAAGPGLPDADEPTVDLFAAETASLLAWTWYLVGGKLASISPLIEARVHAEIDRRILTPNLAREDFWWMGFGGERTVNNWNPWINSNWLAAVLLMEKDPARRVAAVEKIIRSLDQFLNPYPTDGGCDEGPGYWNRAGASLFECLDLLSLASGGRLSFFRELLIQEMGRYIYRVYIGNDYFVNFADASAQPQPDPLVIYRYGKAIGDETMMRFAAFLARKEGLLQGPVPGSFGGLARILPGFAVLEEIGRVIPEEALLRDTWLPDLEVMTARSEAATTSGFYLAAKGGHNAESHNHNDVGNFILFFDAEPLLIDVGVGTYTNRTFSAQRYSIWTMQSAYHNLPTINDTMQQAGREFEARNVDYSAAPDRVTFEVDIAGAYPDSAGVENWKRRLELERRRTLTLTEEFQLAHRRGETYWSFLTPVLASLSGLPGKVVLRSHDRAFELRYDPQQVRPALEEIQTDDARLTAVWGDRLTRIRFLLQDPGVEGKVRFIVLESND